MKWYEKLLSLVQKFMYGRYGLDQLSTALLFIFLPLSFLTAFTNEILIVSLSFIPLILFYFRVFSKNIVKRREENRKFLKVGQPFKNGFSKKLSQLKGMKTHKYYKCPQCKQRLRVPKGKGNISITCPKCQNVFKKRT